MRASRNAGIAVSLVLLFVVSCASSKKPKEIYDVEVVGFDQADEATAEKLTLGVLRAHGIQAGGYANAGAAGVCVLPGQAAEARKILQQEQAGLTEKERKSFYIVWTCDKERPPVQLDFLKDLPAFHKVSMNMPEEEFLNILREQKLDYQRTVSPYRLDQPGSMFTTYWVKPKTHVVVVFMFRDGHCCGVQRMQD